MNIILTRANGGLRIDPAPPYILDYLQYTHRSFETRNYRRVNKFEKKLLYKICSEGGAITLQGFFTKITELIEQNYDTYSVVDLRTPLPEIDLDRIKQINLRDYQVLPFLEFLNKSQDNSGIVCATGGWGKTIAQMVTYAAYNKLNTILAIPLKEVFNQTYNKFVSYFPEKHIGRVGGGFNDISKDITITTFKSLPKCALEKCQLLLVDEIQSTTGDSILETLTQCQPIRSFGYTATDENLFNKADKLLKGIFGDRLIYIPYDEAVESNAVVPGVVYFVDMPTNIIVSANTTEGKINQGIKSCSERNELIGEICSLIPDKWQTIVFVDHINDHLVKLYKCMPSGTKYLHRSTRKKDVGNFALTEKQQNEIIAEFCSNQFQYLIATDAFRAGVDVPNCRVVVQASGGSSEIEILQEAFRGSRTLPKERQEELGVTEKTHFVLIDIMDNHNDTLRNMSLKRMEIYKKQGWVIKQVKSPAEIDWYNYNQTNNSLT